MIFTLTFSEAIFSFDSCFFKEAIKTEIDNITKNNTWVLVDLPPCAKSIGFKWIFKRKYNPDGSIENIKQG